jgi:hypothetical protein
MDASNKISNIEELQEKVEQLDTLLKNKIDELFEVEKDYEESIKDKLALADDLEECEFFIFCVIFAKAILLLTLLTPLQANLKITS